MEVRGAGKRFGGTQVLQGIDLSLRRGSIHGLVGENGAGKSTLGKIITGVHRLDEGEMLVAGSAVSYRSPHDALKDGLTIVAQELSLVPTRSVMENVLLGDESSQFGLLRTGDMEERYEQLEASAQFGLPGHVRVDSLRLGDQQKVEILRAVARSAELVVMDEPTAALDNEEAKRLIAILRRLSSEGTTVLFISHNLDEVLAVSDEVTILRDGKHVRTAPAEEETTDSLIRGMIGRSLDSNFPSRTAPPHHSTPVLEVRDLSSDFLQDVSFKIMPGEIVGLAGLVGSGRSEVAHALFGADASSGTVLIDGEKVDVHSPRTAMEAGIALVPESRKEQGLMLIRSVLENVTIACLDEFKTGPLIRRGSERRRGEEMLKAVDLRGGSPDLPVSALSGGNQQKVLLAKWLMRQPRLYIADEPTRGVDVGAKRSIYNLLHDLAAGGMGVLLIASELEEILGLAHRILVMHRGRIAAEFEVEEASEEKILMHAFGPSKLAGGNDSYPGRSG